MIPRRRLVVVAALCLVAASLTPAFATVKKKTKKKGYDYDKSRYKAYGALTDLEPKTYRFDENGNPVPPPGSKKTAKKKKKSAAASCDGAEACAASSETHDAQAQPPRSDAPAASGASASASVDSD